MREVRVYEFEECILETQLEIVIVQLGLVSTRVSDEFDNVQLDVASVGADRGEIFSSRYNGDQPTTAILAVGLGVLVI